MTSKKRPARPERTPEREDHVEAEDLPQGAEEHAEQEIEDALDSMPEGARADIWRFIEKGEREYVDTVPAADYSPALVRTYGGGRYIVYFMKPGRKGGWVANGTRKLNIDRNVRPTNPALLGAAAPAAGVSASSAVDEVVRQMRVQAELSERQLKSTVDNATMLQTMQTAVMNSILQGRPEPAKSDTVDVVVKILTAVTPLLAPLFARLLTPPPGGLTGKDMLDLGRELATRGGGVKETLSLIREAQDLIPGGDGGGSATTRVLERALDLGTRVVEKWQGNAPGEAGREAIIQELPPGATMPVPDTAHPFFKELASAMPELLEHASKGHVAATYGALLFDRVPASHRPPLLELLERPTVLEELEAAFPQAAPFRPWFRQVVDDLAGRLEDALTPPKPGR
jgi:hypothetical protein